MWSVLLASIFLLHLVLLCFIRSYLCHQATRAHQLFLPETEVTCYWHSLCCFQLYIFSIWSPVVVEGFEILYVMVWSSLDLVCWYWFFFWKCMSRWLFSICFDCFVICEKSFVGFFWFYQSCHVYWNYLLYSFCIFFPSYISKFRVFNSCFINELILGEHSMLRP